MELATCPHCDYLNGKEAVVYADGVAYSPTGLTYPGNVDG